MKKKILALITGLLMLTLSVSQAATYTLPEKMRNQLSIGSGLKGTFIIHAEGEQADTPFLDAVTDAQFSVRGMTSGEDFHYYVFQADENENQSAVTELYRKDGICYLRSDMVQGKILAFPTTSEAMESFFPVKGDNPSIAPFLYKILSIPEKEMNDKWKPVLNRYQNELEMWLADFTVQADIVKMENGNSALDFTYVIPMEQVKQQTVVIFREITQDSEAMALLDTVMTPEEKAVYANGNLIYYYEEVLSSMDLSGDIRMNKRVSAMGDVLSSSVEMPLDLKSTGYSKLMIESNEKETVYRLSNEENTIVIGVPSTKDNNTQEYTKTVYYTNVTVTSGEEKTNLSVRADIQKTSRQYDDEAEKSHLEEHYSVKIVQDETYLPENYDKSMLSPFEETTAELELHYSSKYSQNSATTLEIRGSIGRGKLNLSLEGTLKTAAPWLFMPFEIIDPIRVSADHPEDIAAFFADWISNAPSIIRHDSDTQISSPDAPESGNEESESAGTEHTEATGEVESGRTGEEETEEPVNADAGE